MICLMFSKIICSLGSHLLKWLHSLLTKSPLLGTPWILLFIHTTMFTGCPSESVSGGQVGE